MSEVNETLKLIPETSPEVVAVKPREIIDQKPEAFVPRELMSFLEKIELDPAQQSVINDQNQPSLTPTTPTNPKISLPVTRTTFLDGFKKKFDDVGNWLTRFIFRQIKLRDGRVSFKPDDS